MSDTHSRTEDQVPTRRAYRWTEEGLRRRRAANYARYGTYSWDVRDRMVVELYLEFKTMAEIGKMFGITRSRVHQILIRAGVPRRASYWRPAPRSELKR